MNTELAKQIQTYLRTIPDFPKPGIQFKDMTPLLEDPQGFQMTIDFFSQFVSGLKVDKIVAIESRGFILGAALAQKLQRGLVLVRKKGKLPSKTIRESYALEYGTDELEIHIDAIKPKERVLIVDDVIATGGTALCAAKLCKRLDADVIGVAALIELTGLNGRAQFGNIPLFTVLQE